METESKKVMKPLNQRAVYASFADLYEKIVNNQIDVDRAESAVQALGGMNRAFALEIKYSELKELTEIRQIEPKVFGEDDHTPNKVVPK